MADLYPECAALCEHANRAASEARTIWFGFLAYGAFLTVAVAGTTHRMMFLEEPIALPILSIELDLVGFYVTAPLILVVLHLYLVVKLVLLSESFANFDRQVDRDIKIAGDREQMRKHLNTTIFLQALKHRRKRQFWMTFLLATLLVITLVIGPLVALLFTQIRFLPYQSEYLTSWHRLLILLDVAVLAGAYEATLRNGSLGRPVVRRWMVYPLAFVFSFASFFAVSFPDECWPRDREAQDRFCFDETWLARRTLISVDVDDGTFSKTRLMSDWIPVSLDLANEDFVDDLKIDNLDKVDATQILRSRSLVGADLRSTDLRKAVFDEADLGSAVLDGARLKGALFDNAYLRKASLRSARLQRASFREARLEGADLRGANLSGALFRRARLQGSMFWYAGLRGASFREAKLVGASLSGTQGQGASFRAADLQGAYFNGAQLQGTLFRSARLQGASFIRSELQGADLSLAHLDGARLRSSSLWRALATDAEGLPLVRSANLKPVVARRPTDDNATEQIDDWLADIPTGELKDEALKRFRILLDPDGENDEALAAYWTSRDVSGDDKRSTKLKAAYVATLRGAIREYACTGGIDAAAAVRGMARSDVLNEVRPGAAYVARDLLGCPVVAYLDRKTCETLMKLAPRTEPEGGLSCGP